MHTKKGLSKISEDSHLLWLIYTKVTHDGSLAGTPAPSDKPGKCAQCPQISNTHTRADTINGEYFNSGEAVNIERRKMICLK